MGVPIVEATVNAFLYENARGREDNEACGPFHIGFDAENELIYLNYAVPEAGASPSSEDIAALVAAFEKRSRTPRLEFATAGAPDVEPALLAAGFSVEHRMPFMIATAESLVAVPQPDGVEIVVFTQADAETVPDEALRGIALVQHEAYEESTPTEEELDSSVPGMRAQLEHGGTYVLARGAAGSADAGAPMGGGALAVPRVGTTEVGGVAVMDQYRRRGIGAAVTHRLTQVGFDSGLECLWLTPAGVDQQRLYLTMGYRSGGDMLFISKP